MSTTSKVRPNTRKEAVYNMLKLYPNSSSRELADIMPYIKVGDISHAVSAMLDKEIIFISGKKHEVGPSGRGVTHRSYSVNHAKVTKNTAPQVKRQPQPQPQGDLFSDLIKTLEAEVTALELWKEAALLRYPDLGIDPLLLEARALLAAEAEKQNCKPAAQAYITGNRDHTVAVQALVKSLGGKK